MNHVQGGLSAAKSTRDTCSVMFVLFMNFSLPMARIYLHLCQNIGIITLLTN